jgi:hypothetical protein
MSTKPTALGRFCCIAPSELTPPASASGNNPSTTNCPGPHARAGQGSLYIAQQTAVGELPRREVDGNPQRRETASLPRHVLGAGGVQHPFADWND